MDLGAAAAGPNPPSEEKGESQPGNPPNAPPQERIIQKEREKSQINIEKQI